jgi:NADH-quinone oxidoreductase subunit J
MTSFVIKSFSMLFIFSSISVILTNNPVYSVLSLIACFFNATCLLLIMGIEFIPISFIVIYVGAIAVLFLFVLMMLNLKSAELSQNNAMLIPILVIVFTAFAFQFFIFFSGNSINSLNLRALDLGMLFEFYGSYHLSQFLSWLLIDNNMESVGKPLFTTYSFEFFITSLILFIAMICSIVLTLHKQFSFRSQSIYFQILTRHDKAIHAFI